MLIFSNTGKVKKSSLEKEHLGWGDQQLFSLQNMITSSLIFRRPSDWSKPGVNNMEAVGSIPVEAIYSRARLSDPSESLPSETIP